MLSDTVIFVRVETSNMQHLYQRADFVKETQNYAGFGITIKCESNSLKRPNQKYKYVC
jgi:hypothetical protein